MAKLTAIFQVCQVVLGTISDSLHVTGILEIIPAIGEQALLFYIPITLNLFCVLYEFGIGPLKDHNMAKKLYVINWALTSIAGVYLFFFDFEQKRFDFTQGSFFLFFLYLFLFGSCHYIISLLKPRKKTHLEEGLVQFTVTSFKLFLWVLFALLYFAVILLLTIILK